MKDIRWHQSLVNFNSALTHLRNAVELSKSRSLSELEQQGLIQAFEFTHELSWNTIKDYFEYQGNTSINGARDATREAFQRGLILDGSNWMEMIKSRNLTSHTYNKEVANDITDKILRLYFTEFTLFFQKMESLK
ncbi:MAG: nucleotidyltransferase substrate binding protein [Bdellovibrionaceae bacterium]|nr:nucleotidyltransferase substrate binding protein [Pseudobdellovibrionaceae bacterium]